MPPVVPGKPQQTHTFQAVGETETPLSLREGGTLGSVQLSYQSWGTLNSGKSNAILIFHALSGSQNVTGETPEVPEAGQFWNGEVKDGWWEPTTLHPRSQFVSAPHRVPRLPDSSHGGGLHESGTLPL